MNDENLFFYSRRVLNEVFGEHLLSFNVCVFCFVYLLHKTLCFQHFSIRNHTKCLDTFLFIEFKCQFYSCSYLCCLHLFLPDCSEITNEWPNVIEYSKSQNKHQIFFDLLFRFFSIAPIRKRSQSNRKKSRN